MKTTDRADDNDLDYLNDIIPYRCPKCGDDRKFSSLSDLRLHLEKNHSYQIGYVRPHSRTQVFDAKSVKTKENMSSVRDGVMFKESTEENITSSDGRSSPLLLSFKEDARILERRLQAAKEAEMRNKVRLKHGKVEKLDEMGAVNDLHQKLMSSRSRQWQAEESLYNIDSVLENLEKSVQRRFQDQHGVISGLVSNLDNREEQLSQANETLHSLQRERQKLIKETQEILQQSEIKNERLQLELERRDNVLHSVKAQLQDLRAKTGESIRQKDNELLLTKDRVHHLELEKESLMREVEELLMVNDKDNLTLKQTLGTKERQLKLVNNELLKIRNEQSDLLDESVKLYETAEIGNQKLKKVIQFKDNKLEQAETELFRLRKMQEDLVSESQLLTNQADHHSQTMRKILEEKEAALSSMRRELARVTEEKDRLLQEPVRGQARGQVRGQATDRPEESNSQNQEPTPTPGTAQHEAENQREVTPTPHPSNAELSKLQIGLKEKQVALEEREKELESLKQFINTTAKKEVVARTRLEEFISELIDRADRAERELDQMKKTAHNSTDHSTGHSTDLPDKNIHNVQRNQQKQLQLSEIPASSPISADRRQGSSTLYSSVVKHLVEATVEPWQNSIPTSAVNTTKEKNPLKEELEDLRGIKPSIRRNSRNSDGRNKSRQRRESKFLGASKRQSSNDTEVMSPDEDSIGYPPLPTAKSLDRRKEFQRTDSNQSYVSQRHGWMDPDSILYSETMEDSELEKVSIDSFNKLPNELHQISGSHPNVVYVPFNRTTGQPIKMEAQEEVERGIISQLNLACEQPLNHHTQEQLNREPEDQPLNHHTQEQLNREPEDVTSDKSSTSRTEFKEIRSRETLDSQREDSGSGERTSTDKDRHSSKLAQLRNRPKRKRREDHERKVTMRSVGVMASIPSFQGTSTESESCEEMSMAENSLSDVNSFSDNHLEEKQEDSFEREVDENGIIWDVDDDSHQSLLESRRFSPYGSEMKSPSIQGGALLDDSDSLDDIPVRDQSRRNGGYDSEELEGLGMSSSSFQTYPPVRKQVNFQTLSEYSDPTHYNVYRGSNNHKVNPKRREGYGILLNDTDDDYEEDIQRWRNFTADINTDLRQDQTGSHGNHQISSGLGKSSTFARLNTMALGRQNYWHREGHSLYSPHSVFAFGEPPLRTMSSPGLHRNFHSPISSWRPQRERFTGRNVGKSSSLSNLNLKASSITDLSLKTAVCKDSTTQTWLLDRRLTEKDLCYMGEISSSVSHSELARNSHSDSRTDSFIQKSDTRSFTSDSTLKSSRSFITDKNSLSGSVEEPREGHGHHSLSSGKSDRRSDIKHEEPLLYTSLINGSKGKSVSENSHSTQNASGSTRSESHKSVCSPKPESPRSGELESEKHGSQRKDNSEGDERQRAVTSSISGGKLELLARRNSSLSDHTQKNSTLSDHTQKNSTLSDHTQKNSMLSDHTQRNSTLSDHTQKNSTLSDHTRKNSTLSDHTQKNSTLSDDTQKNSQSVLAKQMGTRQSPGVVTEDKFSNQSLSSMNSKDMNRESSLKSIKTSNRDAEDSKQRPEISETREQKLLFSNDDESMKDDTSLDLSKSSHSEHDSESGHSLFPNPGTRNVVDNELSENKYNRSKSPSSGTKTNKSKENNDSQIKDGSSINTETFYDPGAISVSRKTRVSGDPGDEAEDASLMTDLSINSNLGDISNQSSNFSNFFNNSELEGQIPEKVKDPDKDKDCLEESAEMLPLAASVKQLHSGASEGESIETSDRGNSPGINTHHIVSPTADFRPFSLAFRETSELPVFSEAQETEDEEDLSTLDSCSVTLSSSGETKVLTSRREATRKRRQALHSIFRFLDINSLLVVAQVCREWKKVSRNRSLWKQVVLENRKCSSKFLISLSNWCTALKHLTLRNLSPRDQWQTEADDVYQSTIRGSLEPGLERLLQVTESTLQSISIISCGTLLTDKSVWLASSYSRMLCTVEYLSSFFPLGPDVMYALGAGCRDITTLKIQPIFPCENEEKFSNKCLQIVSQFCCDLETLSIGSSNIDINGLVLIAKGCQRLRQLELHHCQEVTSDISVAVCRLGLKHLLSLSFIHTPVTADALKHFYNTCKHLKYLHVALSVKDFQHGNTEKEQAKLKKWQKFVKDMKGLEKKPGLGNILKLNLQDT